jgi:hypothetical protein
MPSVQPYTPPAPSAPSDNTVSPQAPTQQPQLQQQPQMGMMMNAGGMGMMMQAQQQQAMMMMQQQSTAQSTIITLSPQHQTVDGALADVAVGSSVWGVSAQDMIFRRDGMVWTRVDGALKQISAGADGEFSVVG